MIAMIALQEPPNDWMLANACRVLRVDGDQLHRFTYRTLPVKTPKHAVVSGPTREDAKRELREALAKVYAGSWDVVFDD